MSLQAIRKFCHDRILLYLSWRVTGKNSWSVQEEMEPGEENSLASVDTNNWCWRRDLGYNLKIEFLYQHYKNVLNSKESIATSRDLFLHLWWFYNFTKSTCSTEILYLQIIDNWWMGKVAIEASEYNGKRRKCEKSGREVVSGKTIAKVDLCLSEVTECGVWYLMC